MPLLSMPTELHLRILSQLDLPSLLKVTATNQYFNNLLDYDLLREAMLAYEEIAHSAFEYRDVSWRDSRPDDFDKTGRRPCYGCLRMLSTDDFFKVRGNRGWEELSVLGICLDHGLRRERRCYPCDAEAGNKFEKAMKAELLQASKSYSKFCPHAQLRARSVLLIRRILGVPHPADTIFC